MDLIELSKLYNISKKQLPLNLANTLKSTIKKSKKGKKKEKDAQKFFILKYVIKRNKTSMFYYQKVLVYFNFL